MKQLIENEVKKIFTDRKHSLSDTEKLKYRDEITDKYRAACDREPSFYEICHVRDEAYRQVEAANWSWIYANCDCTYEPYWFGDI